MEKSMFKPEPRVVKNRPRTQARMVFAGRSSSYYTDLLALTDQLDFGSTHIPDSSADFRIR